VSLRLLELTDFRTFGAARLAPEPEGTTAIRDGLAVFPGTIEDVGQRGVMVPEEDTGFPVSGLVLECGPLLLDGLLQELTSLRHISRVLARKGKVVQCTTEFHSRRDIVGLQDRRLLT